MSFHGYRLMIIESESGNLAGQAKLALEAKRQGQHMLRQPVRSLVTAVGSGGTDPFASCSLEVTPRMNVLIDHCENQFSFPYTRTFRS